MRTRTTSRSKRSAIKPRIKTSTQTRPADADGASALSAVMTSVMTTVRAGEELTGTIATLAKAVDKLTRGEATHAVTQVRSTIDAAAVTALHAKKTFGLGKIAVGGIKVAFRDVVEQIKEKPEPFIAAALPAVVGLFLLIRRAQSSRGRSRQRTNQIAN